MASLEELGRKVKAKYPDYADMSDLEVGRRVKAKYPTDYSDFSGSDANMKSAHAATNAATPSSQEGDWRSQLWAQHPGIKAAATTALSGLPVAGNITMPIVGAPLAAASGPAALLTEMGLGSAGAVGGELARQGISRTIGLDPGAPEIGSQAIAGALPAPIMKGMGWMGEKTMQAAIRANPEVAKTVMEFGIQATQKGKGVLLGALRKAGVATDQLLANADRALGKHFPMPDLAITGLKDVMASENAAAIGEADLRMLKKEALKFARNFRGLKLPSELDKIVGRLDSEANPIYAAKNRGDALAPGDYLIAQYKKAMADRARQALRDLSPHVTGDIKLPNGVATSSIQEAKALEGRLIDAKNTIWPEVRGERPLAGAVMQRVPAAALGGAMGGFEGAHGPGGSVGRAMLHGSMFGLGMGLMGSPAMTLRLALTMGNPWVQQLLSQAVRGVAQPGIQQSSE